MKPFYSMIAGLTAVATLTFLTFMNSIIGAAIGAAVGLAIGAFPPFRDIFHDVREALHIGPMAIWQFSALLGYVGTFFRSTITTATKP